MQIFFKPRKSRSYSAVKIEHFREQGLQHCGTTASIYLAHACPCSPSVQLSIDGRVALLVLGRQLRLDLHDLDPLRLNGLLVVVVAVVGPRVDVRVRWCLALFPASSSAFPLFPKKQGT